MAEDEAELILIKDAMALPASAFSKASCLT